MSTIVIILIIVFVILMFFGVLMLAEDHDIIATISLIFSIIALTSSAVVSHAEDDKIREYSVSLVETFTNEDNESHIYRILIEIENGRYTYVFVTDDEMKAYYKDNKFYISKTDLNKLSK